MRWRLIMIVERALLTLAPLAVTSAVVEGYVGSVTALFEGVTLALRSFPL